MRCHGKAKSGAQCGRPAIKETEHCHQHRAHPVGETAADSRAVGKPTDWDIAISAAYLRLLGMSQERAAASAGCDERTLRGWEHSAWWPEAEAQARERWLKTARAAAMRAHLRSLEDPGEQAGQSRWTLERLMPEFVPPKLRTEVGGPDGGPVPLDIEVVFVGDDEDKD